ncbi:polyprenyl synthetase family protein [Actinomadura sp. GTD37]|uniref:polyprenyl synthetase family protein n=1 Tax=Actinomadura sp. GTD37 TaxID=1778030 RepID=UPI0035BFFB48
MTIRPVEGVRPAAVAADVRETVRRFGDRVGARVDAVLLDDRDRDASLGPFAPDVADAVRTAASGGGKRLRPALVLLGFAGAGGPAADPRVVDLGAALELLHTAFLVHDDVMDDSPTRRGGPAAHARFADAHRLSGYSGERRRFAEGAAVTAGDYAFFCAAGLLADAGADARREFHAMAKDVCVGQYLDLVAAARPVDDGPDPADIARCKTARYTVEGPLRLGAALAGRIEEFGGALGAYGRSAGLAFQFRDDLIGALGDPAATGKPVGDDLRQGKRTMLLAYARERLAAGDASRRGLLDRIGDGRLREDEVPAAQRLLLDLGDPAATGKPVGDDLRQGKRTMLLAYARERLAAGDASRRGLLDRIGDGRLREDEVPAAQRLLLDLGVPEHVRRVCSGLAQEAADAIEEAGLDPRVRDNLRQFAFLVADVAHIPALPQ